MSKVKTAPAAQKPEKQKYMNIRIKPRVQRALKVYAAKRGLSMSEAIEQLLFVAKEL